MLGIVPASLGGRHYGAHRLGQAFIFFMQRDDLVFGCEELVLCSSVFSRFSSSVHGAELDIDSLKDAACGDDFPSILLSLSIGPSPK